MQKIIRDVCLLLLMSASTVAGHWWIVKQQKMELPESDRVRIDALTAEVTALHEKVTTNNVTQVLYLKIMLLKRQDITPKLAWEIAKNVEHYSRVYERDPDLVLALIAVESYFDPKAVSSMGAQGLMQVMPLWKRSACMEDDLLGVEGSVRCGLKILSFYQDMYKNLDVALVAYNRGPGAVDAAMRRGENPSNGYEASVLKTYERLRRLNLGIHGLAPDPAIRQKPPTQVITASAAAVQ